MEKRRLRLHKKKKNWVLIAAGLSSSIISVGLLSSSAVSADEIVLKGYGTHTINDASTNTNITVDIVKNDAQTQYGDVVITTDLTNSNSNVNITVVDENNQPISTTTTVVDNKRVITLNTNVQTIPQISSSNNTSLTQTEQNTNTQASNNTVGNNYQNTSSEAPNTFEANNQVFENDSSSFEHVDGFLTADSWYRPRKILKEGTNWMNSIETDLRPILMTWWPDKATQAAYLNYWAKEGFLVSGTYTQNTSSDILNSASQIVQANIEKTISKVGQTQWLRDKMKSFVSSQTQWNITSESPTYGDNKDHLQYGALTFTNSDKTSYANSEYRLLNRNPTQQNGKVNYYKASYAGYELLLANDVDNSNPVVQAEQLNHLHYLMNWGSLTQNDADANFDGIRIDAVDNIDADLLQIATDYFNSKYRTDKSEKAAIDHLSILEAWSGNDPDYVKNNGNFSLAIDNDLRSTMLYSLTKPLNNRFNLNQLPTVGLVNRTYSQNQNIIPNYIFIRAHDSEVQTVIQKIINAEINPNTDGTTFTLDELQKAFAIYNQDMNATNKRYTHYNIPSAYALMLSNKDSMTRVYYGDMYTDDGQYMAKKSPYYDAIDTLLKAKIKYVAGGQKMAFNAIRSGNMSDSNKGIVTSIRYGKGASTASDVGTTETRSSGMAVLIGNQPDLSLRPLEKIILNMGAAHKNQAYRPLLLSTTTGLATYLNDSDVSSQLYKYTDSSGNLTFNSSDIKGYSNPQVSGYLSVWVPVGAKENQDVRTYASDKNVADGVIYKATDNLDSQVIFEGFSNFQDFVKNSSQYTNKVIAQNAAQFKKWGITQFEMAPQYVSSQDGSFLDSIILNGYAFTDRYDLAMSKNNKYGSSEDLKNALKALHAQGIKVLADWVPDQIYTLPGKEVVTVTRTSNTGVVKEDSNLRQKAYVVHTKSSGDLQEVYGGKYLDELKSMYPEIFRRKQISTGKVIDASTKIKNWSAKYFNGSNILGLGSNYVLSDNGRYLRTLTTDFMLPLSLKNSYGVPSGFIKKTTGIQYLDVKGNPVKNAFVTVDSSKTYYFDASGNMVRGLQTIENQIYYFNEDGQMVTDKIIKYNNKSYYFANDGKMLRTGFHSFTIDGKEKWRYFTNEGVMAVGQHYVNGLPLYFGADGIQVKGDFAYENGKKYYYDTNWGNLVTNAWRQLPNTTKWIYLNASGNPLVGKQTINGLSLYFGADGIQVKGDFAYENGKKYYYDADWGNLVTNAWRQLPNTEQWIYLDASGSPLTGDQIVNGVLLHFNNEGIQTKGDTARDKNNILRFYKIDDGSQAQDGWYQGQNNQWVFVQNGKVLTGQQVIDNNRVYFNEFGYQVKGDIVKSVNGKINYYHPDSGNIISNQWQQVNNQWMYFNNDGNALVGRHKINNVLIEFNEMGYQQFKSGLQKDSDGHWVFYESGHLVTDTFKEVNGKTYYFDTNGHAVTGRFQINGVWFEFTNDGQLIKHGWFTTLDGYKQYYDLNTGVQLKNQILLIDKKWYYFDSLGNLSSGVHQVNGLTVNINADGSLANNQIFKLNDGTFRRLDNKGQISKLGRYRISLGGKKIIVAFDSFGIGRS